VKISNVALVLAAVGLAGCSSSSAPRAGARPEPAGAEPGEPEPAKVDVVQSAQQRNTDPQLSELERDILAASQVGFAVDFYHAVRKQPGSDDKDIFLSPHSVSIALAMTYAGARAETAAEMRKALRFALSDERLHTGFGYLDLELARRGQGATGKDGKPFRLDVASSIWGQSGSSFEMPFLDTLAINYGAGLNVVDFVRETEKSRVAINRWVEDKTEKRITDLMPKSVLTPDTRMVLVNAVYFDGGWASPFAPNGTKPAPFTKADGSTVDVMMMNEVSPHPYVKGDGYEAVEMVYDDKALSMLVIAPTKGAFATFESSLTGRKVLDILASLETKEIHLFFPKLRVEGAFKLKEPLKALGMQKAFNESANFSGMSTTEKLVVQDVLHKTFAEIDENGTVAAAGTGVVVGNVSAPPPPPQMRVDRPFITAIVDRPTKTILFLGRILEPKL
jgi:serpin B